MKKHQKIPARMGRINASRVNRLLPVSFFIVSTVVEQGQCISENSMTQTAVTGVQPFSRKIRFSSARLPSS